MSLEANIPEKIIQCKDIPSAPILIFISKHGGIGCNWFSINKFDNPRSVRHAMLEGVPRKVVLAKMKHLISKGYISGCACGCRGDFELTERGLQVI